MGSWYVCVRKNIACERVFWLGKKKGPEKKRKIASDAKLVAPGLSFGPIPNQNRLDLCQPLFGKMNPR